jgi:hypothetical protein
LLAQRAFRHKSRKRDFQIVFWVTVVINCGVLLIYSSPSALRAVLSILGAKAQVLSIFARVSGSLT